MKIIAQQTDALNTYDFWNNVIEKDYIDAMALNVALTKDNQILTYNITAVPVCGSATGQRTLVFHLIQTVKQSDDDSCLSIVLRLRNTACFPRGPISFSGSTLPQSSSQKKQCPA